MQIETYEAISLDEQNGAVLKEEVSEEALALIETLGLDGQRELLAEREVDGETVTTRNPYREMTAEERVIFGAVLSRKVELERYADGPIPLRVLQVAAHAKDLRLDVEVWCPQTRTDPDPLLVGYDGEKFTPTRKTFILARWGDVLVPLDELREKARLIILATARQKIAKAKSELAQFEANLTENLEVHLRTGEDEHVWIGLSFAR